MPRITFLIGHKGVGRSTLLRRLAESEIPLWGRNTRYVDLDDQVQRGALMPIEMILQREGEEGLRERERVALDGLAASNDPVNDSVCVALGSGFSNWEHPALNPAHALFLWVRRTSDAVGRVFLGRPRFNPAIPPLEEFEQRARFRASRFLRLAQVEFWVREGATTFTESELSFLGRRPLRSLERLLPEQSRGNTRLLLGSAPPSIQKAGPRHRGAVLATSALEAERLATPLEDFCRRRKEFMLELTLAPEDAPAALAALPGMGIRWAVFGDGLRAAALEHARASGVSLVTQRASRVGMVDFLAWDSTGLLKRADCCSVPGVRVLFREWARRAGLGQPRQASDLALWGGGSLLPVVRDELPQAIPPGTTIVVDEDEEEDGPPPFPRALVTLGGRSLFRQAGSPMPPEDWHLDWLIDTEVGEESPGREIAQLRGARFLGGELLHREFSLEVRRVVSELDDYFSTTPR